MTHHSPVHVTRKLVRFLVLPVLAALLLLLIQEPGKKHLRQKGAAPDVLPTRVRILAETSAESIDQSIDALPSFTDWALATSIGLDTPSNDSYGTAQVVLPRLNRVRKLLAQIDESQKPHYTAIFLRKIDECMDGYLASWREYLAMVGQPGGFTFSKPTDYHRKRTTASALVYILTEWERHDALPTFRRLLDQPEPIPVNRLFLLYSCHILVESLPQETMSPEQLDKLKEYKRAAEKTFPSAPRTKVPAWNAKYDETDFRAIILGQRIPTKSEPQIELRIYPDLSRLEDPNTCQLWEEADVLQRLMLSFLRMK